MDIQLSSVSITRLMRPVRGRGGFQQLLRRLQSRVQGAVLAINPEEFEKLWRYSHAYGRGGFQERTKSPASEAQQAFDFEQTA